MMPILRNPRKRNFTVIANYALRDDNLSLRARGLLASIMSFPDDWQFSESGLDKTFLKDGITAIRSGLKELESCGYLTRTRCRDECGRLSNVVWTISDYPQSGKPRLENPSVDKPSMDKPSVDNHTQLNTKQLNNERLSTKELNTDRSTSHWENDPGLSQKLKTAIADWLSYKAERRESYKPTGLKSLITQVKTNAEKYGEDSVVDVMVSSMGSGYKGICFDKLKNTSWKRQDEGNPFLEMLKEEEERKYGQSGNTEDYVTV